MNIELKEKIAAVMRATEAAAQAVVQEELITIVMFLQRYDLATKEPPHGSDVVRLAWIVPIVGRCELSRKIVLTNDMLKDFKIEKGIVLTGNVVVRLIEVGAPSGIFEPGFTMTQEKKDPATLTTFDFAGCPWNISFKFSPGGVLEQVDFVHDSEEHPQLTAYWLEVAKKRKINAFANSPLLAGLAGDLAN